MQGGGAAAVVVLPNAPTIIRTHAVAEERSDVLRIVFATLIASTREADPCARAIDASAGTGGQWRERGAEYPAAGVQLSSHPRLLEQHLDHRNVLKHRRVAQFAKLARSGRSPLEQIQLAHGHQNIQTTQRYLGSELDLADAADGARVGPRSSVGRVLSNVRTLV